MNTSTGTANRPPRVCVAEERAQPGHAGDQLQRELGALETGDAVAQQQQRQHRKQQRQVAVGHRVELAGGRASAGAQHQPADVDHRIPDAQQQAEQAMGQNRARNPQRGGQDQQHGQEARGLFHLRALPQAVHEQAGQHADQHHRHAHAHPHILASVVAPDLPGRGRAHHEQHDDAQQDQQVIARAATVQGRHQQHRGQPERDREGPCQGEVGAGRTEWRHGHDLGNAA
ncbi:hypothetical protein V8017_00415 [Stenotrophomonas rhizophila]